MRLRTNLAALAVVMAAGALPAMGQDGGVRWRPVLPTTNSSGGAGGVYKPDRGVLFVADVAGNAWEWDGVRWVHLASRGPRNMIRWGLSYGYDPGRNAVTVVGDGVYGGQWGPHIAYTHDFDGVAWNTTTFANSSLHELRSGAGTGYHPGLGGIVAIGGYTNNSSPGSSEWHSSARLWDGTSWSALPSILAHRRSGASVVYDPGRDRLVMTGGSDDVFAYEDVQEYVDGQGWSVIVDPFPFSVGRGFLHYDHEAARVVAFGGFSSGAISIRYEWDGAQWTSQPRSEPVSYPPPKSSSRYFYDQARDTFIVVNGAVYPPNEYSFARSSTLEFHDGQWREMQPAMPVGRWAPGMVWDSVRGRVLMFSGYIFSNVGRAEDSNGMWAWDGRLWSRVATGGPVARSNFGMAFDSRRDRAVVFGGRSPDSSEPLPAVTWEWDGTAWAQAAASGPSARSRFAMVYDERRGVTVLFGGTTNATAGLGDTWEYDGAWRRVNVPGPAARFRHGMAYDAGRGVVVLFGGTTNNSDRLGDTWEYDGVAWTRRDVTGPGARIGHAMVYDAGLGKTLVINGWTTRSGEDTWAWDGSAWTLLDVGVAGGTTYSGVAYDAARRQVVLVGGGYSTQAGQLGEIHDDVRLLGADCPTPVIHTQPGNVTAAGWGDATLSIGVEPGFDYEYQWRRGIVPRPIQGANGPTLTLQRVTLADAGVYDCVITSAAVGCHARRVFSAKATVTVCLADRNADGFVDGSDYAQFVIAFETGEPTADANGDGFVDWFDYDAYVAAFETGC